MIFLKFGTIVSVVLSFVLCCDVLNESCVKCPYFKSLSSLNVQDLVGSWLTVYTKPKSINCFTLHIRATTDLERERNVFKYGNFSGRVNWDTCFLEVESPLGKHYLQGTGGSGGLLENIILRKSDKRGEYKLYEQSPDQWSLWGRRGREVLVMRDCGGSAAAAFARAPYWPTAHELYALLHRSGIAPMAQGRLLCEPRDFPATHHSNSRYYYESHRKL